MIGNNKLNSTNEIRKKCVQTNIIEVDGKFHDEHKLHDKNRTKEIQEQYPSVEVLRYRWKDLSDMDKMDELLYKVNAI